MADGRILLTGATGNVGPHLLAGLLQSGDDEVACLVRAGDDEAGRARVLGALASAGYDARALGPRVAAVAGDLALPRFGLAPAAWAALADTTRHVVHCGAWLGQRERFSVGALTNIAGTTAAVDLCARAGAPLDYVSTIGVLAWTTPGPDGALLEDAPTAPPEPPRDDTGQYAYHFSKWMAEQIAAYAAGAVPVTVHRLGDVFAQAADAPLSAVANVITT
ncbi:MAG TPA: SDR family oxidoreductase, partial [Polyangiaceae bacterium]|nr:SDR family oxidoreductase [Polyangiaceae bacterium]